MRAIHSWPFSLLLVASPALAQEQAAPAAEAGQSLPDPTEAASQADAVSDLQQARPADLIVVGQRIKGQLETSQAPIATLNEGDIQALGVGSIGELVSRISPQTGSGRGRGDGPPVIMVNGQRITNFREMRNFPPEAIQRVEILPEETALRYGYPPDSRVINLILKKKYRSLAIEEASSLPTRGGFVGGAVEATLTRIAGPSRLSITGNVSAASPLFESERDIIQPAGSDPNTARFRSLVAQSRNYGLNLAWTRGYGKDGMDGTLTVSAAANRADSRSWQGINPVQPSVPMHQDSHVTTLQAGLGYNRQLGRWQFSATLDGTHGETRTFTDSRTIVGQDTAKSTSNRLENLTTLIGRPVRLPAGEVTATLKTGFTWIGFDSSSSNFPASPTKLHRFRVLGGANLALPLTSRRENVLGAIGDFTLNLSADLSHLSDFGTVNGWSSGLTWAPTSKLNLQVSYIVNQTAPSISQLGNPVTVIANVPVYDFARGETTLVSITSGGNPLLRKEQQRDLKLGLTWQMPVLGGSNLVVEYFRNRSNNVTASFPLLTSDIEAAFPGRVTRDGSGRLVAIDQRPVTFYRQASSRLRWGFNLSAPFGRVEGIGGPAPAPGGRGPGAAPPAPPPGGGGAPPRPAPRAGGPRGGGGGGGMGMLMGGPSGQPGRWSLGVFHTVQFTSRVMIAPSGPSLDLLNGDSLSTSGTPRHSVEFNGGVFYKGLGLFTQGTWNAPTRVAASGAPGTSDLRFGSLASVNLFLFFDFSQRPKLVKQVPFLKGARVTLRVENLLDAHQRVTDGSGLVPLSYQADYMDPRGRVISLSLRKLF